MKRLRYVGGATAGVQNTPYQFTSYGQLVELPDDVARACLESNISLITEEDFSKIHPTDEVKKFSRFDSHSRAPQEFLDQRDRAWEVARGMHHPDMVSKMFDKAPV